jgi:hypothetical protein
MHYQNLKSVAEYNNIQIMKSSIREHQNSSTAAAAADGLSLHFLAEPIRFQLSSPDDSFFDM